MNTEEFHKESKKPGRGLSFPGFLASLLNSFCFRFNSKKICKSLWARRRRIVGVLFMSASVSIATFAIAWWCCPFPMDRLEHWPVSPVVMDRTGSEMLSVVGSDEQWRFPVTLDCISPRLIQATIAVEDERFYSHRGVDPLAMLRAVGQNVLHLRTVSGASTLTMQVCRMMYDSPRWTSAEPARARTWRAKIVESFRALQLERCETKSRILETYLNVAPYGGNVRGVEAAARKWFGKRASDLSLGEAALLAGLPQSPTRYRPDRHPEAALARRERVLQRMEECGFISVEEANRARDETIARITLPSELPDSPSQEFAAASPSLRTGSEYAAHATQNNSKHIDHIRITRCGTAVSAVRTGETPVPHPVSDWLLAPQAAWLALQRRPSGGRTTIDPAIQSEVQQRVIEHAANWPARTQAAALVIDIARSDVVAMIGSAHRGDPGGGQVNGVIARRSPGSTLKPFVYAAAFEAGLIGPDSIVYDVPIERAGWSPVNFDGTFSGKLSAGDALRRSLNIPAILTAEAVGLPRCLGTIESAGIHLPGNAQSLGGLAVVTGAIEVTLLDLVNGYATLGRSGVRCRPRLFVDETSNSVPALAAQTCAVIDDVLSCRRRQPRGVMESSNDIAWFMWKTGTSSGRRDAWAVGHNRRYAIGVWMGRFSGAGQPELIGAEAAEPLLARLFQSASLRCENQPPPVQYEKRPDLASPLPAHNSLRILQPYTGTELIAIHGAATVRPSASCDGRLNWFLNGRLLASDEQQTLRLTPGKYELRCSDDTGAFDSVTFHVRSEPVPMTMNR